MIYVDRELCTGCGICLPACNHGALSLRGNAVIVDESLCSSCGRCTDTCLTGAIISMEVVPQPPLPALAQIPEAQPFWAGAQSLSSNQGVPAIPQRATISKLDVIERVFGGLFAIAAYVPERKRGRSSWSATATQRPGNATLSSGVGGGRCSGGHQRRGTKQGQESGCRLGGGRSLGGSATSGDRRRMNRRNRATR